MTLNNPKEMPVYLFTGFLEAGKTKFIQETLEDRRFCNGERTLLLVCEEGESSRTKAFSSARSRTRASSTPSISPRW